MFSAKFLNNDDFQNLISQVTDIDQGIRKKAIQKIRFFSVFEKNLFFSEKEKNPTLVYTRTTLYTHKKIKFCLQSESVCLRTKFDLRLKKNIKKVVWPSKKC